MPWGVPLGLERGCLPGPLDFPIQGTKSRQRIETCPREAVAHALDLVLEAPPFLEVCVVWVWRGGWRWQYRLPWTWTEPLLGQVPVSVWNVY